MLCSECFTNEGLRIESKKIGSNSKMQCTNCLCNDATILDADNCYQLMQQFFVYGSVPPNVGEMAPVYMVNDYDHKYELPHIYKHDHDLLKKETGLSAFHYGPPLWRLGYTEYYNDLEDDKADLKAVDALLTKCTSATIPAGQKIYRIRTNPAGNIFDEQSYDSPPSKKEYGRFDSPTLNVLYGSFDIEACIHECKSTLIDEIVLATLVVNKELHLINFFDNFLQTEDGPFKSVSLTMHTLQMTTTNYHHCRRLALRARELGYDGFIYKSFYSIAKEQEIKNIGIFGRPVSERTLSLDSLNRIRLRKMDIDYILGPL